MAQYKDKRFPAFPGAYIINTGIGSFPIYKSTPDLEGAGSMGAGNKNEYLLVMPGYQITIYTNTNYSSDVTAQSFNNSDSSQIYIAKHHPRIG
jgi:hypothetical protein